MTITELVDRSFMMAQAKGFHDNRSLAGRDDTLVRLCLIHTEVSEAAQLVKKRHPTYAHLTGINRPSGRLTEYSESLAEELADIAIRLGDLAGCLGINLDQAIERKMAINLARPHKYGTPQEGKTDDHHEGDDRSMPVEMPVSAMQTGTHAGRRS